jgi:tetratricopeptide (TPR) repeat protein
VHGFSGSASETFGSTPDMLMDQDEFKGWDIFSIGYSSDIFPSIGKGMWSVNPNITKIGMYLNTLLSNQFSDYNRIALVAHSMGGLAVQRAILDADTAIQQKISHVLFFGTPSAGLKKASWFDKWNEQIKDLSNESEFINLLRSDWNEKFPTDYYFSFKTIAGSKDEFVPVDSSLVPFNKKYHGVIEGNHINMIKPKDKNDIQHQSFQIILKSLTDKNTDDLKGDPEELNLLLGEYQTIINKYLANAKLIDTKALVKLVFALECNGRREDAIRILLEHPEVNKNSDVMGIIGGRYKRKYLLDSLQSDLDHAFEYYEKGMTLSQSNQDNKQIFYHAINLAFLNIVAKNNLQEMKRYSEIALENCNPVSDDMWEIATIAEANMYLGTIDKAEEYYKQAAFIAGTDARSKTSMYSNAYVGYQALTSSSNKNASFLKMLEEILL